MRKSKLPIVNENAFSLEDENLVIRVGSDEWYAWLSINKGFRYVPMQEGWTLNYGITVYKRDTGFWYAYRRVNSKLRQTYLGKTEILDFDTLQAASIRLSLGDVEWYKMKKKR